MQWAESRVASPPAWGEARTLQGSLLSAAAPVEHSEHGWEDLDGSKTPTLQLSAYCSFSRLLLEFTPSQGHWHSGRLPCSPLDKLLKFFAPSPLASSSESVSPQLSKNTKPHGFSLALDKEWSS